MIGEGAVDERVHEPTPARRRRALEQGNGPRASWLASAISGLVAVGLLSVAAGPVTGEAKAWMRESLAVSTGGPAVSGKDVLMPAITGALAIVLAVLIASLTVHGPRVRLQARPRSGRAGWLAHARSAAAGWGLAAVGMGGGVFAALPWLPSLASLASRALSDGLWSLGAFAAAVAIASLLAVAGMGLLQWWAASRRFERMLRMTHAEARDAAKEERRPGRATPRWRLA